jgi:hypothetical protein
MSPAALKAWKSPREGEHRPISEQLIIEKPGLFADFLSLSDASGLECENGSTVHFKRKNP